MLFSSDFCNGSGFISDTSFNAGWVPIWLVKSLIIHCEVVVMIMSSRLKGEIVQFAAAMRSDCTIYLAVREDFERESGPVQRWFV